MPKSRAESRSASKALALISQLETQDIVGVNPGIIVSGHLIPAEIEDLNDYQIPNWPTTPEGEERQAEEIVRHYRSLVSHPAVQAINYWG